MKHKKSQKIHFKTRWKERVGYELSDEKYEDLKRLIKDEGKCDRLEKEVKILKEK